MRTISSSWVFIFWPERIRDRGRKCYIAVYTCRLDQPSAFSTVKEIRLRIRFLRKFVVITDVILTHSHDHCARKQVSRFSSSSSFETKVTTTLNIDRPSTTGPLFSTNSPTRWCSFEINLSKCNVARDVIFFFTVRWYSRARRNEERAKPTCTVYASKACKSTRVAAVSWPTITELTPTVVLRRLFTWSNGLKATMTGSSTL